MLNKRCAVKAGILSLVVLSHILLIYALTTTSIPITVQAGQHEVSVELITPDAPKAKVAQAPPPAPKPVKQAPIPKPRPKPVEKPVIEQPTTPTHTEQKTEKVEMAKQDSKPAEEPTKNQASTAKNVASANQSNQGEPKLVTSGIEYRIPPRLEYPILSKRIGEEGEVTYKVLVDDRGNLVNIQLYESSGSVRLDEAAYRALRKAVFKPHIENGKPVPMYAMSIFRFSLRSY